MGHGFLAQLEQRSLGHVRSWPGAVGWAGSGALGPSARSGRAESPWVVQLSAPRRVPQRLYLTHPARCGGDGSGSAARGDPFGVGASRGSEERFRTSNAASTTHAVLCN